MHKGKLSIGIRNFLRVEYGKSITVCDARTGSCIDLIPVHVALIPLYLKRAKKKTERGIITYGKLSRENKKWRKLQITYAWNTEIPRFPDDFYPDILRGRHTVYSVSLRLWIYPLENSIYFPYNRSHKFYSTNYKISR